MAGKKKSGGGIKEVILSGIMLILIAGLVLFVARSNDIRNFEDARLYLTAMGNNFQDCYPFSPNECPWWDPNFAEGGSSGSGGSENNGSGSGSGDNGSDGSGSENGSSGSGDNGNAGDGSSSAREQFDLSEIATEFDNGSHNDYRAVLEDIEISAPDEDIDYDRSEWRHWTGSPCNTRNEVLIAQGEGVETGDRCRIEAGTWVDPFTGDTYDNSSDLDIDHIVALGYAAQHGGNDWDEERKEEFANDMLNLRAVDAGENRSKGADGPSSYMPPNSDFHCEYAIIWIDALNKYELSTTEDDKEELQRALNTC